MQKLPEEPNEELQSLQKKFYKALTTFFSGGTYDNTLLHFMEALNENLKSANTGLEKLNENIKKAEESSGALAEALNKITFWGTIIATVSLIVAVAAVALEYCEFLIAQ